MAEIETLKEHIDAEEPEARVARAAKKLAQGMYVCAKVAKLYVKYGVREQVFTPIPTHTPNPVKGGGHLPRSAWRALRGKTVEQMKAASMQCQTCHLPLNAMKIGGVMQKCKCKQKANK